MGLFYLTAPDKHEYLSPEKSKFSDIWVIPFRKSGRFGRISNVTKVLHVGTINFCQKVPGKMQKDFGHFVNSIQRKRPKYDEN